MGKYAKGILAAVTAVAVSISTLVAADSGLGQVVTVVLALLGALAVYATPNKGAPVA